MRTLLLGLATATALAVSLPAFALNPQPLPPGRTASVHHTALCHGKHGKALVRCQRQPDYTKWVKGSGK